MKTQAIPKIKAVLILAGGQSSRMGSAKALLSLPNGQTLLNFHLDNAKELNLPILLADNHKNFVTNQCITVIQDYLASDNLGKGQGALSAIASGLRQLQDDGYLLVVGCDNLLKLDTIAQTLSQTTAQVGYLKGDKDYPLLGVYHSSILPSLIQFLALGHRSVMQFLKMVGCQTFAIANDLEPLANFNTKADFEKAIQQFKRLTK